MFSFSYEERNHLFFACVIFVLVELSTIIKYNPTIVDLFIFGILSFPLFLLHELAHKFIAIRQGFPSRFYLDRNLALFSLISILPFFFIKIIAPGAVVFYGTPSKESEARVAMAGPLTNIILGGILLGVSFFLSDTWMFFTLLVSKFSFDLALFNLIPISILDGAKINKWNSTVFIVIFIFTLAAWLLHPYGLLEVL
jgi:Zn-dependent protease